MNSALFISFNNLFNCAVKIFIKRTYSFILDKGSFDLKVLVQINIQM